MTKNQKSPLTDVKQGLTEGIVAFDVKGYKVVDILGKSIKNLQGGN